MVVYILRRLLYLIPILFGVSLLTFAIIQITPGDPARLMLGKYATPERIAEVRTKLGLDDPLLEQYGRYVWNIMHGDLGQSFRRQTPVMDEIMTNFPSTMALTTSAMCLALVFGIGIGVIAATVQRPWVSNSMMMLSLVGLSIPEFWLAIMLLILFGVTLKWVPITGAQGLKGLLLPAITLALAPSAVLARLTRSSLLEVIHEDYVRTALSKGLAWRTVVRTHVLKNALIPVVTVLGLQFAGLLAGTVFIENVFARPGIGRLAVNAIIARDYPIVQGVVLFSATIYALINLVVDLLYGFLDPRIRYD
ncbi:MAG: ABC transporter permease [Anaerolineales bacterium]|nr:ABC transporter permease [Anaerolineales bacterium]